jgi:hypothetical protein
MIDFKVLILCSESCGVCNSSEAGLNYRPSAVPCWQGRVEVEEEEDSGLAQVVDRLQRELVRPLSNYFKPVNTYGNKNVDKYVIDHIIESTRGFS